MNIEKIFCYFTPAEKGNEDDEYVSNSITSIELLNTDPVFQTLQKIYSTIKKDADLNIIFNSTGPEQNNEVRNQLINILTERNKESGFELALRLSKMTDKKSKCGLFFIIIGKNEETKNIVLIRFPAEEAMILNKTETKVEIQELKEVFLKNSHRYKLAFFEGNTIKGSLWNGLAIDKQINDSYTDMREISKYWINDFLDCQLVITSRKGSTMFAKSLRTILNSTDDEQLKDDIIATSMAAKTINDKNTSISSFINSLSIKQSSKDTIIKTLGNRAIAETVFKFNVEDFSKIFNLKVRYLDSGAIIMAPADEFDKDFSPELIDSTKNKYRYTTEGITQKETIKAKA